jgi:hypothetical protein
MRKVLIAGLALIAPLTQVEAQPSQAARELNYCERLYEMTYRYVAPIPRNVGYMRDGMADLAIDRCRNGRFAEGIPILEAKLQHSRIPLPDR